MNAFTFSLFMYSLDKALLQSQLLLKKEQHHVHPFEISIIQ